MLVKFCFTLTKRSNNKGVNSLDSPKQGDNTLKLENNFRKSAAPKESPEMKLNFLCYHCNLGQNTAAYVLHVLKGTF